MLAFRYSLHRFLGKKKEFLLAFYYKAIHDTSAPFRKGSAALQGLRSGLSMANEQEKKQDTPNYGAVFI